jgi:hypothetical protein
MEDLFDVVEKRPCEEEPWCIYTGAHSDCELFVHGYETCLCTLDKSNEGEDSSKRRPVLSILPNQD